MGNLTHRIQTVANVAILIGVVSLAILSARHYLINSSRNDEQLKIGDRLPLSGLDGTQEGQTLLLILQKGCPYCEASVPFYRHLVDEAARSGKVHLIAVLPQEPSESRRYMNGMGVHIDEVKQYPLRSLKVRSTPTILLINNIGVVIKGWVGLLNSDQQSEVLRECCQE